HFAAQPPVNLREAAKRFAFADIDHYRRRRDIRRVLGELRESGNQVDREIVDSIVAEILETLEDGRFARAAQASDDDQLGLLRLTFRPLSRELVARHPRSGPFSLQSGRYCRRGASRARPGDRFPRHGTPRSRGLARTRAKPRPASSAYGPGCG